MLVGRQASVVLQELMELAVPEASVVLQALRELVEPQASVVLQALRELVVPQASVASVVLWVLKGELKEPGEHQASEVL